MGMGMPLELIADRPGHAILRVYEEPPLQPDQIRIRSLFSSVKHGTELRLFRGDSEDTLYRWDGNLRLHVREEKPQVQFPMRLGNMCLGRVTEVGVQVTRLKVGDQVFGHLPLRETHTVQEDRVQVAPPGVSPESLMYWDPADFAVGGVRDGYVRLGDRVAVLGLGAIGQMVVQVARLAGARWVVAVDPIERRRSAAARHGVDLVLDPAQVDVGVEVKRLTGNIGVDVALETSGSSSALYDALRSTRYQGTVVSTAYYVGSAQGLFLAGEWHRNRINIVSSRACSEPLPEYGWTFERIRFESLSLLVEGRLKADDLIDPIVSFARSAEAYQEINEHPERSIKLGIDHT
jgi:threonine dehydrogenase-like Zn-dependent dehydrogenase